ncbi:MAG: DNA polymerase III subunit delta [Hyphomicrobiales bacterium]
MTILKPGSLSSSLRSDLGKVIAVLVYGPDEGGVRERVNAVTAAVVGKAPDPFAVMKLDDADLASDPGRLADEAQAYSLLGGRRVVRVENAGSAFVKAIEPLAAADATANLIVAEAGSLPKSSKLRALFETEKRLWCIPCYEDSAGDLQELIAEELAGFKLDAEAREALAGLLGADRQLSRQELRKLALYCHGRLSIELEDIAAVCGDVTGAGADDLLHAAFGGDLSETSRLFHRLVASGSSSSGLLSMGISHAARLTRLRSEMRRGRSADSVVRGARPPVLFKVQDALIRELKSWDEEALIGASHILSRATIDSRENALLQDQIAERAFLSLARSALQQRRAA